MRARHARRAAGADTPRTECPTPAPPAAGLTLVEVLMVVGILTVLVALGGVVARQFHTESLVRAEADALAGDFRRAQARAVAGQGDTAHGVHLEASPSDRWVLFAGNAYAAGAPSNETHVAPAAIDIETVALTGGATDVVFAERRGTPSATGTLTLRGPTGQTRTVSISAAGIIDLQ